MNLSHIRLLVTFETCEVCFKVDLYGLKMATSSFLIHRRFKKILLQNLSGIITNPPQQEHKLPHFQWPIVCLIFGRVWARTNNHIPQYLSMLSIPVCDTQDITYSYIIMPPRHYLNYFWNIVKWIFRNTLKWNVNWNSYHSSKCIGNCLRNGGHFISA